MGMRIFPEVSGSFDAHASPRNMRACPQWFLLKSNRKILGGNIGKFGMEKSARGIMYSSLPPIVVTREPIEQTSSDVYSMPPYVLNQ